MRRLITLMIAGALLVAACGGSDTTEQTSTTAAETQQEPSTTTEATTTTTEAATTTEATTTTTEAPEEKWLSEMSDSEIAEAMGGACMMIAFGWEISGPIPVEQFGEEFVELITEGSPSEEDASRAMKEAGWIFVTQDCPSEVEGFTIPEGADEYLAEVGEWLIEAAGEV